MTMSDEEAKKFIASLIALNTKIAPFLQNTMVREKLFDQLAEEMKRQSDASFYYLNIFLDWFQDTHYR